MDIIIWSNAALFLPGVPLGWVIAGCVVLSFPTNYLRDFSLLSFLSAFGIGCIVLIVAVVVFEVGTLLASAGPGAFAHMDLAQPSAADQRVHHASRPHGPREPATHLRRDEDAQRLPPHALPLLRGHVPLLRGGRRCGYLLYGEGASVLITQDMGNAGGDSVLSHILIQLVNLGITFKLYCSVPTCVVVLVDIAQNLYLDSKGVQLSDGATDAVRFVLWGLTVLGSIATYTSLKYVTALIGINSMLISVLLPILFYIILHGKQMTRSHRAVLAAIVAFSVCLTLVITYVDFLEFLGSLADLADSDEADDALDGVGDGGGGVA